MVNFKLVFLLLMSLVPSLGYLLVYRKLKQQWEAKLKRVRWIANCSHLSYRENVSDFYPLEEELELAVSYIGDISCLYNARSPYIRCASNRFLALPNLLGKTIRIKVLKALFGKGLSF